MRIIENIVPQAFARNGSGADASIGRLLRDMGKITPEDTALVLARQAETGRRFGQTARELGMVSERDIETVLAHQFGYQYVQTDQSMLDTSLVAALDPFGEEAEMLRAVRAQLNLRWFSGHKTLAIAPLDDKASAHVVAANLAIVFAQQGQRTLLVDADMRTPKQQDLFHVRARTGLSEALAGRVVDWQAAPVAPFDRLSLLCAGPPPPNPHELLGRPSFATLNDNFVRDFDIVLYSAPPCAVGGDAYTIASQAKGVLLVVSKSATLQSQVRKVQSQLAHAGVEIVGSLLIDF